MITTTVYQKCPGCGNKEVFVVKTGSEVIFYYEGRETGFERPFGGTEVEWGCKKCDHKWGYRTE